MGGFIAGLAVAMLSGLVSRRTPLKEDASFAGFYLGSLALGVTLVSLRGSSVDLLHVLFGSILAVDAQAMLMVGAIASVSLLALAALYRALVIESFDVTFLRVNAPRRLALIHGLFLALVVVNLVAGFQILGTLMSVGLMMLPAASARFWARNLPQTLATAMGIGALSSLIGLVWSYYASLPAGPAIVLSASVIFSSRSCLERAEAFTPSRAVEKCHLQGESMKRLPISLAVAALLTSPLAMAKTVDAVASFSILGISSNRWGRSRQGQHAGGAGWRSAQFRAFAAGRQKLAQADVVFVSGLGLEGWIDRLVSASGYKGQVITASQGISTRQMEEDGKAITDPHAWNSMKNGVQYATNVMNALIAVDPEDANYFRQRGAEYIQQLQSWTCGPKPSSPQCRHRNVKC